jgi:hypothetical protein
MTRENPSLQCEILYRDSLQSCRAGPEEQLQQQSSNGLAVRGTGVKVALSHAAAKGITEGQPLAQGMDATGMNGPAWSVRSSWRVDSRQAEKQKLKDSMFTAGSGNSV